jgi:hypothetical protein
VVDGVVPILLHGKAFACHSNRLPICYSRNSQFGVFAAMS